MKKKADDFLHTATLRVRYSETDKMGIVYNANYLSWFEISRTELCRIYGKTYREWEAMGILLPVVEAHCRYKKGAQYDDQVHLFCRAPIAQIKPQSIVFEYKVMLEGEGLLAEGWTKHAFVGANGKLFRKDNPLQLWMIENAGKHQNA